MLGTFALSTRGHRGLSRQFMYVHVLPFPFTLRATKLFETEFWHVLNGDGILTDILRLVGLSADHGKQWPFP